MNRDISDGFDGLLDVNRRGVLKGLAAGSIMGFSLPVEASTDGSTQITVRQNGQEVASVSPITTDRSIENFYRYDEIDRASANTPMNLREEGASKLFFYRQSGSDKISLVVIHDEPNNGNGGDVRFDFEPNSLPDGDGWVVKDDPGEGYSRTHADWAWAPCCTDGGAYRGGFSDGVEVTIDPSFNGGIGRWGLLDGDGSDVADLSMSDPVTLTVGASSIPDDLETLVDGKLALADRIDANAVGLMNDRERVEPVLQGLVEAAESDEGPNRSKVVEAVQRMFAGEQVTDAVLAGAGPGSSPHLDTDTNISKLTVEYAVNPILEIIFMGISFLKVLRYIPGLGGLVKSAARSIAGLVADVAGYFSKSLESLIRARAEEAGLAIFQGAEEVAKKEGKKIGEEQFREVRDTQGAPFIEDSSAVVFDDMLFNEERDWNGNETDPLDESVEELVNGLDISSGGTLAGDTGDALGAADDALNDINSGYEDLDQALSEGIGALFLKNIGLLEAALVAVAIVGGVFGASVPFVGVPVLSAALATAAAVGAAAFATSMILWGTGSTGILGQRYNHQLAVQRILDPSGG